MLKKSVVSVLLAVGLTGLGSVMAQPSTVVNLEGGWRMNKSQDPMTDKVKINVFKLSPDGKGTLAIRCGDTNKFEPLWLYGKYLTKGASFLYRFDKETPMSVPADQMATSQRGLFLDEQIGFVDKMKAANVLTLQARDRDGDIVTQTFELAGFTKSLADASREAPCR